MTSGKPIRGWLAVVAGTVAVLAGFDIRARPVGTGLDESFVYAFNEASARGLRWGEEFLSTYGPYGFLLLTLDVGNHLAYRVAFSLVLSALLGVAVWLYVGSFDQLPAWKAVGSTFLLIYLARLQQEDEYRLLCVMLLLMLAGLGRRARALHFALAGFLAGVGLMLKFSLGLSAVVTLVWGSLVTASGGMRARQGLAGLAGVAAGFLLGWLGYARGLSGVGQYLVAAWELSRGYSSAMSFVPPGWWVGVAGFVGYGAVVAGWTAARGDSRARREMALLAAPLFVAWKHSVVRQDGHVIHGMMFGLFVLGILLTQGLAIRRLVSATVVAGVSAAFLLLPWLNPLTGGPDPVGGLVMRLRNAATMRGVESVGTLVGQLDAYRRGLARASAESLISRSLPETVRQRIGAAGVDVYPWEVSYVPANALKWLNRPMPASFNAYTPYIDALNAAFFRSGSRPDFLLWHHEAGMLSIDGRYLLFDEPETVRALLDTYELMETDGRVSVLRAVGGGKFSAPEVVGSVSAPWGTWVPVPDEPGVVLARVELTRSILARVMRVVFREDPVTARVRFASGFETGFRLVPDNMPSGLWISPFPSTVEELLSLLEEGPAQQVRAIRLDAGVLLRAGSELAISWVRMKRVGPPRREAVLSGGPAVGATEEECSGAIDGAWLVRDWHGRRYIEAVGWALDGQFPVEQDALWLTDEGGRTLPTRVTGGMLRQDVVRAVAVATLERAGWVARAMVEGSPGDVGYVVKSRRGVFLHSCNRMRVRGDGPLSGG